MAAASPATGFWLDELYCHLETGRRDNNLWPHQYVEADRERSMAPFDVMIRNGWRRQNLLGSHHFTEDATRLTESGKLRVQWIMSQTPPEHRQVFVERSIDDSITQARIAAANDFASVVARDGATPSVSDTHIISDGRPATTVDYVNTTFRENMPIPALPESNYEGIGAPE